MDRTASQTRMQEIFGEDVSTSSSVRQFRLSSGFGYQISARVLPFLYGSIYVIPSNDYGWIMIDSGSGDADSNSDIENGFKIIHEEFDSSFTPEKLRYIFLTHAHYDHFGGVHELHRRINAKVVVHSLESRLVEHYDEVANVENCRYTHFLLESGVPLELTEPILDGFGFRPGRAKPTPVDTVIFGGEKVDSLQTVYLPGHSAGHLGYLCGDVIFSGDLLLSKTLTQIWPARMTPQTGMLNYIRSLLRLKRLAIEYERRCGKKLVALPAHEDPIYDIPYRVDKALRSMERRNSRLIELLGEESSSATLWEILPKMYWSGRPNREFFGLSDVGARIEFFLQLNLLKIANSDRLSYKSPAIHYQLLLSNTEAAKNTIKKIVGMYLTGDQPDLI